MSSSDSFPTDAPAVRLQPAGEAGEDQAAPALRESSSAAGETPSAVEEAAPTVDEAPPAGDEAPSAGEETMAGEPEAWEPWETRLVLYSLAIGFVGLLILGWLVDRFILA